ICCCCNIRSDCAADWFERAQMQTNLPTTSICQIIPAMWGTQQHSRECMLLRVPPPSPVLPKRDHQKTIKSENASIAPAALDSVGASHYH
ncbi:hypothetical protein L9F63_023915, partial [Diploptera punctata]